ncbi:MAG: thioester-forming surface-anchored protein, partial [Lachnospiraceae bacterium]|nr:thioester-forming surface-anchored protein [Lachnospiraceae bacterium]
MNRLAKKSLTASVLLTMILSLMPAINARADGGYTATAVPDKDFSTGGVSNHISYAAFDISDQGATAAFCLNYGYIAPNASGVSGYTAKTVQPSSQNQAVDLLDKYAGSDSFQTAYWHGEDLYKKVMTVLYYGYKGDGSAKIIGDQKLTDQRDELYRIATQFAIWHYTDGKTTFGDLIKQKDAFFNKVTDNKLSSDDTIWAYQMYSKLIDDSLALPDGFYQNHELTIYVAPDWEIDKAKFKHWQNMISVRSIRDRKGKEFDFSKVDVNGSGSKELPGAQLSVKGKDDRGNDVNESWTSGNTAHRFKLYPGSYTMTETQSPTGFQKTTETVDFVVKEVNGDLKIELKKDGSQVDKVVMKNVPSPMAVVSKQDLDSHAEIAGAQLQITGRSDNDEEIQTISWTSEAGKSHQVNLYFGVYTLTETGVPDGYLKADPITFKVVKGDKDGTFKIQIKQSDGSYKDLNDSKVVMLDKKNPNPTPPNSNSSSSKPNTP